MNLAYHLFLVFAGLQKVVVMSKQNAQEMLNKFLKENKGRRLKLAEIEEFLKNMAGGKTASKRQEEPGDRYPLARLNANLLEKVVTKLDLTSYFRIQQTCHAMKDFIQKSKNICVHANISMRLETLPGSEGQFQLICKKKKVDASPIYGVRLSSVLIDTLNGKMILDFLEQRRLQCRELSFYQHFDDGDIWSKEDVQRLLNVLKPARLCLTSQSDHYEALFNSPQLKRVYISIGSIGAEKFVPSLLSSSFSCVIINIDCTAAPYTFVEGIVKMLLVYNFPHMEYWRLGISFQEEIVKETIEEILDGFELETVHREEDGGYLTLVVKLPNGLYLVTMGDTSYLKVSTSDINPYEY